MGANPQPRRSTITVGSAEYAVYLCPEGHVHLDIMVPDSEPVQLSMDDMQAYELAQALLRGFDHLNGIAEKT